MAHVDGAELDRRARAGPVTPDHAIRTKGWPLVAPAPRPGALDAFRAAAAREFARYAGDYRAYFARHDGRRGPPKTPLDPVPRVGSRPRPGAVRPRQVGGGGGRRRRPGGDRGAGDSPTPRRSTGSRASARTTCSTSNTGRWSRRNSARPPNRRWRATSSSSPAARGPSGAPPPRRSPPPAPRSRRSTWRARSPSPARRSASSAT